MQASVIILLTTVWSVLTTVSAQRMFTCESGNYIPVREGGLPPVPRINMDCPEIGHPCRCVTNTLGERLHFERMHDMNNNGTIEGAELANNLQPADDDNNGCIGEDETERHHVPAYGESAGLLRAVARDFLQGNANCSGYPLHYIRYEMPPYPVDDYIGLFIEMIVNFCEADPSLYYTNCDCAQLPHTCLYSEFRSFDQCRTYREQYLPGREGCVFNPPRGSGQEGSILRMVPYNLIFATLLSYMFIYRSMKSTA